MLWPGASGQGPRAELARRQEGQRQRRRRRHHRHRLARQEAVAARGRAPHRARDGGRRATRRAARRELEHPARRRQASRPDGLGERGDEEGDVAGAPMPVGRARVDRQDGPARVPEERREHERARGAPEPDRLRAEYALGEGRRQLSERGPSRQRGLRSRHAHPRLLSGHPLTGTIHPPPRQNKTAGASALDGAVEPLTDSPGRGRSSASRARSTSRRS